MMTPRIPADIKIHKPNYNGVMTVTLKVPEQKYSYTITVGDKLPMFTFMPTSAEIYHRLILRATLAKSIDDFKL
jgi:hypothetical protein